SSARTPMLMMSWVPASAEISESETSIGPIDDRTSIDARPKQQPGADGERNGQQPAGEAHRDGAGRARVVERLADGHDHRGEHPNRGHDEGWYRDPRQDAEDSEKAGRRGEPERAKHLADVDARLRLGHEAAADLHGQQRPRAPRQQ